MKKVDNIVSDYNGYDYKKIFWEDADRKYEDKADRLAVRRLLPKRMEKFADIAGGYGRLAPEYLSRAKHAILFDYSQSELDQAKEKYGDRLETRQGDIYALPFEDDELSSLLMVRATHHFKDIDKVLKELYRVLQPGGTAVIEVANKRTLPRIIRYATGRSGDSPFDHSVANLKDVAQDGFFNYHPKYIEDLLRKTGFKITKVLSVSNFRSSALKRIFGYKFLLALEKPFQYIFAPIRFAPSIYYRLEKPGDK